MTTKTFPAITPTCSKCGHSAPVYISDENVRKDLESYARSRFLDLWRPLMVRRIFALAGVSFTIGLVIGWFMR